MTIREEMRQRIAAVCHVDGTGRLQTVKKEWNPRFYELIERFRQLTGIPVLLNTSFNVMGEPVVESPEQAIRCYYSGGLDALVIGNFIIQKR